MVRTTEHDPFALLRFALREADWELADLVACFLVADRPSRIRASREILAGADRPGAPDSLATLHRWATMSRDLDLDPD